jgi:two-component system nitrate/nitrite response regulator NarL
MMNREPSPIRILIVDDHPTMLWGLERLIGSQGPAMEVVATAASPEDALAQGAKHRPDLVLLDLNLGERSGLEVVPELMAQGAQVLVLTGERSDEVMDKAVQLGVRGVLRKDASADMVLKAVHKVHQGELWLDRLTLGRVLHGLMEPRAGQRPCPEKEKQSQLTQREQKIIEVILDGRGAGNKALASRLFISEHTLRNHLSSIYHKLGVANRLELYVYAITHHLGARCTDSLPA